MELFHLTAHEIHDLLIKREVSAVEVAESVFQQIDKVEETIHSYITLMRESALAKAAAVDEKIKSGEEIPPLAGVPIAIKDLMCTKGVLTTCGSKILLNFIPPYDSTAVSKLKAMDAVIVGKANISRYQVCT